MIERIRTVGLVFLASAAMTFAQAPCERLKALSLKNVTITAAEAFVAFPPGTLPSAQGTLPTGCRVAAFLTPSSDSHIEIELWLPAMKNWNGKFQAVGNGGWTGSIAYARMASAFKEGYQA